MYKPLMLAIAMSLGTAAWAISPTPGNEPIQPI